MCCILLRDIFRSSYWLHFLVKLDKGRYGYITEYDAISTMHGSGMPKYANTEENVAAVEELTLSQEGWHNPAI